MLQHLIQYFNLDSGILNVFRYQTFRAMCAFMACFGLSLLAMPKLIAFMQRVGKQPIRVDGPNTHHSKAGTPTMGGVVIVLAVIIGTLLFADVSNSLIWLALTVFFVHAVLGFFDDYLKIIKKNSAGVSGKVKLLVQFIVAIGAAVYLMNVGFGSYITVPFLKDVKLELSYLYILFVSLVIVGTSNAVNLTDGLDGLAIGSVITVAITYAVFCYLSGNSQYAQYLSLNYVAGIGELTIVLAAVVGAGLGFLWFNTYPAQVFMGDVGALALGALLGIIAVCVRQELLLPVAGGIFVVEALSVIIQRYYYKLTGKRFFRMAPIHHHFELQGVAEPKIIIRFWIVAIILAIASIATLKLR